MADVDNTQKESVTAALPGLGRALISVGKLTQKSAEDTYKKSQSSKISFIAELTASGVVSAADLAHTVPSVFGAPLLVSMLSIHCAYHGIYLIPKYARLIRLLY